MSFELPELDRKETQMAVERELSKYRMAKYLSFDEREATTTPAYIERLHGPTNTTSDQTAEIAIHNAAEQEKRKAHCEWMERSVRRLPKMERFLIETRYMGDDAEYITDHSVYAFKFAPPVSQVTYIKIRWKAFYKLALNLNIAVVKD